MDPLRFVLSYLSVAAIAGGSACASAPSAGAVGAAPSHVEPARVRAVEPPYLGTELCYNGWDDNENRLIDEGCGVPQAPVVVMLAWSELDADLDLLVTDPDGELATKQAPTKSGLGVLMDCPLDDECGDQPYEIAVVEDEQYLGGRYRVQILARKFEPSQAPIRARVGIVTPEGTHAHELEFFDVGQSVALDFAVAQPAQSE